MVKRLLVRGARQLLTLRGTPGPRRGAALRDLAIIEGGAMLVEDGVITSVGQDRRVENLREARQAEELDATGQVVMPGFVDSHTHLVHGPARLDDYEARLEGQSYAEIAAHGGGILSSMRAVRLATARRLLSRARLDLQRMAAHGTTTVEAKSGYGLDEASEVKCLKVAAALDGDPIDVISTFLGAHATPPEFSSPDSYIDHLIANVLPVVATRQLARFADVYCDDGAFNFEQARRYLSAARALGLAPRLHAAQWHDLGAVHLAIELAAASIDHLEALDARDIAPLARSNVVATLLPGSVLHLGLSRYAPARALIDAGAALALATDYNPGSSPTLNMQTIVSLGCSQMRMLPAEALAAATINGACALGLGDRIGTLEAGKQADFIVLGVADYREVPYYFGVNHVLKTVKRGQLVTAPEEQSTP
jgi:imidazolonepropionase